MTGNEIRCVRCGLNLPPFDHQLLQFGDRPGRVETLGAGLRAVEDSHAAEQAERVLELIKPLPGRLVARIAHPAIGVQERGWAEIAVRVPPIFRTRGGAAGAQDAFVEAVELLAVLPALLPFVVR